MNYITSTRKKKDGCVFCAAYHDDPEHDHENFMVYRGKFVFALMNIYPYNTGHLMVLPYAHVATLTEVSQEAQFELISLASYLTDLLTQLMSPDGFNIGFNIGQAAGAGIEDHLHLHIVPRWSGDSNFMSVVGETRVLPEELGSTYDKIMNLLQNQPPRLA
jgi:ATP adenylyltransferase